MAQKEIQRYTYHFERYANHEKSRKIIDKQMVKIKEQCEQLHEIKGYPAEELTFFEETANVVRDARLVLKWTYAVAYYMKDPNSKEYTQMEIDLFNYQQSGLEEATERCVETLEKDISPFLATDATERSPFYHYKSQLMGLMQSLKSQYSGFVDAIYQARM